MRRIVQGRRANMSRIKRALAAHFVPPRRAALPTVRSVNKAFPAFAMCLALPLQAAALDDALAQRVQALADDAAQRAAPALRVQVRLGQLDARLKLAPCAQVQPYLPTGTRLWGASRIGLRCLDAGVRWNVYLPLTVDVFGPGLVAAAPLAAGATLTAADLKPATINLAASPSPAVAAAPLAVGRALARPLAAGQALHSADLRARQWFAAGDTVRLVAAGSGWRIHGEGQALNVGLEGQTVRVRTESGRVVTGTAAGERHVELSL
jgi:flagellar basal body P-ring formation protein FlgA